MHYVLLLRLRANLVICADHEDRNVWSSSIRQAVHSNSLRNTTISPLARLENSWSDKRYRIWTSTMRSGSASAPKSFVAYLSNPRQSDAWDTLMLRAIGWLRTFSTSILCCMGSGTVDPYFLKPESVTKRRCKSCEPTDFSPQPILALFVLVRALPSLQRYSSRMAS